MPAEIAGKDLVKWGLAKVCRRIINNRISETLFNRNGAASQPNKIHFFQLFNFHYADSARMLTVGGLFLNGRDDDAAARSISKT